MYSLEGPEESDLQKGVLQLDQTHIPKQFALYPAYPNPFNPITTIKFDVPGNDVLKPISLSIFDATGREVESLISGKQMPGTYRVKWNAAGYASGVYFVRLMFGQSTQIKKILLLK